jgi:hypothetical protein
MFAERLDVAISGARTLARLDRLSRLIWQGHGSGALGDTDAQRLAERLHAARGETRKTIIPVGIPLGRESIFPPRRAQYSPDRTLSLLRRRKLAASGPLPPALASMYTVGELAVLRIVGDTVKRQGCCSASIGEIAARAGVCRTLVQNAIREAARQGLVTIEERRRQGQKNLPNVVRIVSREWLTWLKRSGVIHKIERIGSRKIDPTDREIDPLPKNRDAPAGKGSSIRALWPSLPPLHNNSG